MRALLAIAFLFACGEKPAPGDGPMRDAGFEEDDSAVRLDSGVVLDAGEDAGIEDTGAADAAEAGMDAAPADGGEEAQRGAIVVSEIQPVGAEWIELYNPSAAEVQVVAGAIVTGGGTFVIRAASDPLGTSATPVVIAPRDYALGHPNPASAAEIPAGADFVFGAPGGAANAFGELGESVELRRGGALEDRIDTRGFPVVLDRATQLSSDALDAASNDDASAWCVPIFSEPTPGAPNSSCRPILISEVTYDGAPEFIELAGAGGASLEGIEVRAGTTAIALTGRMPLSGLYSIEPVSLHDDTAAIRVLRGGVVLDAFAYGSTTGEGRPVPDLDVEIHAANWARSDGELDTGDNAADFHHDPSPTPGARNSTTAFAVTRVEPDDAIAGIEAAVIVEGTDFTDAMAVSLGVPATCTFLAANVLECAAVAAAPGRTGVVVDSRLGSITMTDAFTWTLTVNESDTPAECDFCILQWPPAITGAAGVISEPIYGRIYEAGLTDVTAGEAPGILAEVGYGPDGTDPSSSNAWTWVRAVFNVEYGNDDEYVQSLVISTPGTYRYTYRWSLDGGVSFSYGDLDGAGYNPNLDFSAQALGTITVN
jgi:hypothetical protein